MKLPKSVARVVLLTLACLTATMSRAGLMHNAGTTPGQAYLDYAQNFPFVGWLGAQIPQGTAFAGSAVLIDRHWAITAAHAVLEDTSDPTSLYDGYRVGFTSNFLEDPGENQFADAVYVHPSYVDVRKGPDVALLHFANAFSLAPAEFYGGPHLIGTSYDLVGFGQSGTVSQGFQSTDGWRRAGANLLTSVDTFDGYLGARFLSPREVAFHPLGVLGGPGDSGGGWFVEVNGQRQLAGLNAFVQGFPTYGAITYATYFPPNVVQWIEATLALHPVPEPGALVLASSMAVGLGVKRPRRRAAC